jgi:hypothetical protein
MQLHVDAIMNRYSLNQRFPGIHLADQVHCPMCRGVTQMKPIQVSQAVMGQATAGVKQFALGATATGPESFGSSWPRQVDSAESSVGKQPAQTTKPANYEVPTPVQGRGSITAQHEDVGATSDELARPIRAGVLTPGGHAVAAPAPREILMQADDRISLGVEVPPQDVNSAAAKMPETKLSVAQQSVTMDATSEAVTASISQPAGPLLSNSASTVTAVVTSTPAKPRPGHAPTASTASVTPGVKHKSDSKTLSLKSEGRSEQRANVVPIHIVDYGSLGGGGATANDATPVIIVGVSSDATQSGNVPQSTHKDSVSKINGTAQQTLVPSASSVAPPPAQVTAPDSVKHMPTSGKQDVSQRSVEEKSKTASAGTIATKVDARPSSATHTEGLTPAANIPRVGLVAPESSLPPSQLAHPTSVIARASGQSGLVSTPTSASTSAPQTIVSTPARLDVGVLNGTHGWLRVRAELGAGGAVNTSITTVDAAHEALRSAVPEIANYLGVEAVKVNSIEVHRFADTAGAPSSAGAEAQPNGEQQSGRRDESAQQGSSDVAPTLAQNSVVDQSPAVGTFTTSNVAGTISDDGWLRNLSSIATGRPWAGGMAGSGVVLNVCA